MVRKLETICYCDICSSKVDEQDVFVSAERPVKKDVVCVRSEWPNNGALRSYVPSTDEYLSTFRVGLGTKRTEVMQDAIVCKECVAKSLGFENWAQLNLALSLVKAREEERNRRTDR